MQRGFLSSTRPIEQPTPVVPAGIDFNDEQQHLGQTAAPGSGSADKTSSTQQGANWQQQWVACLQLLRSDVDEKKFVGLLLVTKLLLLQGKDEAIQDVLDAVGFSFLQRLLMPLQLQQQQDVDAAKLQQQHLSVVLGLSILSAACRLKDVAAGDELLQLVPLLLKVAAAGGVAHVLQPPLSAATRQTGQASSSSNGAAAAAGQAESSWADAAAEAGAVVDALECVVACASSGTYQHLVVVESGGFQAAVAALQSALTALHTTDAAGSGQAAADGDAADATGSGNAASALQAVMLSVQLLSLLLGSQAAQLVSQDPAVAAAAVMLLCRAFGGQLTHAEHSSGSSIKAGSGPDPAALQLQAQHTLLLLLPLPDGSQAAAMLAQAAEAAAAAGVDAAGRAAGPSHQQQQHVVHAAAAAAGDWPAALQHGLCQIMRSRVGVVQRHSALRLAAACLELLGPAWLLPQQQRTAGACSSSSSSSSTDQFLLVLMELLAIETPLLLSDAMNPEAAVPRADQSMAARKATDSTAAAKSSQQQGPEAEMDTDADSEAREQPGQTDQPETLSVQQVLQHIQQQEAQGSSSSSNNQHTPSSPGQFPPGYKQGFNKDKPLRQQLAELQLPEEKPPGPGQQGAGERAQQCLPSCFQLLEGCLEVLVAQVDMLEQLADIHAPDDSIMQHDGPGHETPAAGFGAAAGPPGAAAAAVAGAGVREVRWSAVLPVLGARQVEQLMQRLQQVTQVLCEFLEHATSAAGSSSINPLLAVGAVRVLGRFLADAPDVHQEAVRQLLPLLLAVGVPSDPLASGVAFLLPAMLSWTSSSSSNHQQWASVLLSPENECLSVLAEFTAQLAAAATSAAASSLGAAAGSPSSSSSSCVSELQSLESCLGTACQVLHQLLSSLPAALAGQQGMQQGGQRQPQQHGAVVTGLQDAQLQQLVPLLQRLCSWATLRCQQQQQQQQQAAAGYAAGCPAAVTAAASFLVSLQQAHLHLHVALPAAALVGQVLVQLARRAEGSTAAAQQAEAAGRVLLWGCEAGWSYQLLEVWQEQQAEVGGGMGPHCGRLAAAVHASEAMLVQLRDVWVAAELAEVWDVCSTAAAELLLEGVGGSLLRSIRGSAWIAEATLGGAAIDEAAAGAAAGGTAAEPPEGSGALLAAAVVEGSMGLQLLVRACEEVA